jgi:uncharacterized protein YcnI
MQHKLRRLCAPAAAAAALVLAPTAIPHAGISPPVVVEGAGQLFSLTVPTEEEGLTTRQVELTVPEGFRVFSFGATPGWERTESRTGSGEETRVSRVRWTGGAVPFGQAAVFQFIGLPDGAEDYRFAVRQTYSDGSVVNWSGPDDAETPAAVVEARSSLGGGGSGSTLSVVALVVAGLALLLAIGGLVGRGRSIA